MPLSAKDLLLAARLDAEQVAQLLAPYGFKDAAKADANLQAIASDPADRQALALILDDLLVFMSQSAHPDRSMNYFERFARSALNKAHLFQYLQDSPRAMEILARTFGASPYIAEILIRDPHYFYWVADPEILNGVRKKREIQREVVRTLRMLETERQRLDYLRVVKRREMLHIGVRDLLRICSVQQTLDALSRLAEVLISMTCSVCASSLRLQYGIPRTAFARFTILGMGKLGGGELNFSSDVDLIYLYDANSRTAADLISAPEFFTRLAQKVTAGLDDFTAEGYLFRVDLRLRPEGRAGHIAGSLEAFARYYRTRIATWERLALLKAWPVAGDRKLGFQFLNSVLPLIYGPAFDEQAQMDVRSMKGKIDQKMVLRDERSRNVKLGAGGIREIELIAQCLQVRYGNSMPQIRHRGTLAALAALCEAKLMSKEECDALTQSYVFLRDVENKLQMANDAQTHSLPGSDEELTVVSRTLGYRSSSDFLNEYQRRTGEVNRIFASRFSPVS